MEAQQVRFFTSADGVRIAYTVFGEGPPLVFPGAWWGSLDLRHATRPGFVALFEHLSRERTIIRSEARGVGASQRDVPEVSIAATARDLRDLVDHLECERFDLFGGFVGSFVAATFAAEHPERVGRVVLSNPVVQGAEITTPEAAHGLMQMIRGNWPLAARSMTGLSSDGAAARGLARMWVRNMSAEVAEQYIAAQSFADLRDVYPRVVAPALVIYAEDNRLGPREAAMHAASLMPNARFVAGKDFADEAEATCAFFGVTPPSRPAGPKPGADVETAAILFVDIAGSTALTEQLGDAAFRARSRELDGALRATIRAAGGTVVEGKVMGDGVMSVFGAARQAIDAALRCREASAGIGLEIHLGLHAGDVIRDGGNVYGGAVNLAARIADSAEPGEILVSDIVRGLARTSADVLFEDRGTRMLKGIEEPQRLWAVTAT